MLEAEVEALVHLGEFQEGPASSLKWDPFQGWEHTPHHIWKFSMVPAIVRVR